MLDKDFLDVLACPKCNSDVLYKNNKLLCANKKCSIEYKVKNGIPIMLV